jgi:RNA polymerase sigma-32 factor
MKMNSDIIALSAPISNLRSYAQLTESYPRLTREQERDLAIQLRETNDIDAAKQLILSHLRNVLYIARGYNGYGLPLEDIVQEGNIGLMKAVKRFDPLQGVRLATYAAYWIRSEIHEYIMKNWRIVKVITTKAKRTLFYKLRGAKPKLGWVNNTDAQEIADTLNVSLADVLDMDTQMYVKDQPFDAPTSSSDEGSWAPEDYLQHADATPEEQAGEKQHRRLASAALSKAMEKLDDRSRHIIASRWLSDDDDKPTLEDLGDRYQLSAERIRQIEANAIAKLKKAIDANLSRSDGELVGDQNLLTA